MNAGCYSRWVDDMEKGGGRSKNSVLFLLQSKKWPYYHILTRAAASESESESAVLAGDGVGIGVDKILPNLTPALWSENNLSSC